MVLTSGKLAVMPTERPEGIAALQRSHKHRVQLHFATLLLVAIATGITSSELAIVTTWRRRRFEVREYSGRED
ncbi:Hypothetical predicted protein [Olea europaea subsp. europaea]|uniref:Uncharacterized protein n=1 Tax=Olea europaea subsp. europaea TaxID=158383 RepID=A0A8S0RM26_OLEEU|nr:Hypothetical predicted protein [Olea europaea subsp. europaea]